MNFDFTDEQKQFAEQVRRFAREHLAKDALKRAHNPRFPFDAAEMIAKQGLMGITLPQNEGGQGGTMMDAVIAIMEVAAACPRSADVVQFGNFGPIRTFAEYGSPAQKARWLGDLLAGRAVMSLGMTEPDAGSALTDLEASAQADGGHYVIDGTKVFSTFSPDAQIFLIYVRFGPGVSGIGSVTLSGSAIPPVRLPTAGTLSMRRGITRRRAASSVARYANSRASSGSSPTRQSSSKAHNSCSIARRPMRIAACHPPTRLPSPKRPVIRRASKSPARRCKSWARWAIAARRWSNIARRARGWMIAGGSIEILKNRIAEYVFDRRFDQRGRSSAAAE